MKTAVGKMATSAAILVYESGMYTLIYTWDIVIESGSDNVEKSGCISVVYIYSLIYDILVFVFLLSYIIKLIALVSFYSPSYIYIKLDMSFLCI